MTTYNVTIQDTVTATETLVAIKKMLGIVEPGWTWVHPDRLPLTSWRRSSTSCACGADPHYMGCNETMGGRVNDALGLADTIDILQYQGAPTGQPTSGLYGLEGFEDNSAATNLWTVGGGANQTYSTTTRGGGATGSYSLKIPNTGTPTNISKTPAAWPTNLYWRVYFMVNNLGGSGSEEHAFAQARNGGTGHYNVMLAIVSGAFKWRIQIGAGTSVQGTTTIASGTWYRLEANFFYHSGGSSKSITARLYEGDSTTLLEEQTTSGTSVGTPLTFQLGDTVSGSRTFDVYYDDLHFREDTYPGPGGIWMAYPSSDSQIVWTPSTGALNYAMVDDFPGAFSSADYVSTGGAANVDLYGFSWAHATPGSGLSLYASDVGANSAIPSSTANIRLKLKTNIATYNGASVLIASSTPSFFTCNAAKNLFMVWSGVPRTQVDNYTFGVERESGSGSPQVYVMWANFELR